MTAPLFQYAGGKRRAAPVVWRALGNVRAYAEPFAGSAAVLLARPAWHLAGAKHVEILNDYSGRITNMYRAIREAPDEVWAHCHGPRAELDLDARLAALTRAGPGLDARLRADPAWHDTRLAAWQLYVCRYALKPRLALGNAQRASCPNADNAQLTRAEIRAVAARLHAGRVVLLCGDWARAVTDRKLFFDKKRGTAGIFLDPPYTTPNRRDDLYDPALGDGRAAGAAARAWAAAKGTDPAYRIVLAGYADEGPPAPGWSEVAWASEVGPHRGSERLWLSPHCLMSAAGAAGLTADPRPVRWEMPAPQAAR